MTIPGGFVAGDTLSAANMNLLPAGKVGYAAVTADQTGITTVADLTSLTVTWTAVSARRYRITGFCTFTTAENVASVEQAQLLITDGSNTQIQIAYGDRVDASVTSLRVMTVCAQVTETGLSGSVTRKLRAQQGGSEAIALEASSTNPSFILVEDIGPA